MYAPHLSTAALLLNGRSYRRGEASSPPPHSTTVSPNSPYFFPVSLPNPVEHSINKVKCKKWHLQKNFPVRSCELRGGNALQTLNCSAERRWVICVRYRINVCCWETIPSVHWSYGSVIFRAGLNVTMKIILTIAPTRYRILYRQAVTI